MMIEYVNFLGRRLLYVGDGEEGVLATEEAYVNGNAPLYTVEGNIVRSTYTKYFAGNTSSIERLSDPVTVRPTRAAVEKFLGKDVADSYTPEVEEASH